MRKPVFLLLLLFCATQLMAQKIDPRLTNTVKQFANAEANARSREANREGTVSFGMNSTDVKKTMEVSFNPDGTVKSFVVLAKTSGMPATLPQGVRLKDKIGSILILDVKAEALDSLSEVPEIEYVSASEILELSNEKAREEVASAYVTGELPGYDVPTFGDGQHYTGKDVVVGIVDRGIDFNHPALRDPKTGKTRVKEAIHFKSTGKMVVTNEDGVDTLTTSDPTTSHGTHVSVTAAGSPVAGVNAQGIAHDADLVLCDCDSILSVTKILMGINEVFHYADSVNKPAVVNLSLGSNIGFHDGTEMFCLGVAELTGFYNRPGKKGHVVCNAAGNEAKRGLSISKKGSIKTLLYTEPTDDGHFYYKENINFWVNAADVDSFTVRFQLVDVNTGLVCDTGNVILPNLVDIPLGAVIYPNNKRGMNIWTTNPIHVPVPGLALAIFVEGANENQQLYFIDANAGRSEELYGEDKNDKLVGYDSGTPDMSICTLSCSDSVLSVGSYVHRPRYKGYNEHTYSSRGDEDYGRIATYSSYGIDENGKPHPDVLAPGMWTVSGFNLYDQTNFSAEGEPKDGRVQITNCFDVTIDDYHRKATYGAMTGTSMACPVMTGVVALWLQADPTLTVGRIREMLPTICNNDKWTTIADNTPNKTLVQAGKGKVDALRGIKLIENIKAGEERYPLDHIITLANNIATYSSNLPLDFYSSAAPKAYAATSFDGESLEFTREEKRVAANTGLLLTGEPGEYHVPIGAIGHQIDNNLLVSTANAPQTIAKEGSVYVLSKQNDLVGFYQNAAGLTVPQGKAYLQLPPEQAGARIRGFQLVEDKPVEVPETENIPIEEALRFSSIYIDNTLGIESVNCASDDNEDKAYNVCGQRVNKGYKGIVIRNGRKYISIP